LSKEKKASKNIWVGGFFAEFRYVTYSSKWLISFIEHFQPHFTVKFIEVLDPIENSKEPKNGIKNETNYESFSGWAINRPFCRLTIFQEKKLCGGYFWSHANKAPCVFYPISFRSTEKKSFFSIENYLSLWNYPFLNNEIKKNIKVSL